MDRYYYLISSLPLLQFSKAPALDSQGFIHEAGKWLSHADLAALSRAAVNNFNQESGDTPLLRKYKEFEYALRARLAAYRKAKKQNSDYALSRDLSSVIQEGGNPLEIEKKLLRLRWDFLEGLGMGHFFDADFLVVYYLKLQLLERLFQFNKEAGRANLRVYSVVE